MVSTRHTPQTAKIETESISKNQEGNKKDQEETAESSTSTLVQNPQPPEETGTQTEEQGERETTRKTLSYLTSLPPSYSFIIPDSSLSSSSSATSPPTTIATPPPVHLININNTDENNTNNSTDLNELPSPPPYPYNEANDRFLITIDSNDSSNQPYDDEPLPSYAVSTQPTSLIANVNTDNLQKSSCKATLFSNLVKFAIVLCLITLIPVFVTLSKAAARNDANDNGQGGY
ncbi:6878_t:CDS:1 [Ambispora leptoticha]|uniref:6878_t:CDS:1 n=1 Tax=Ambispora leptoticha TaxID=144679 RepID=A0A9N9G3U6_9GLOM|nr:6878_t:CDS:1 [Ambispora leptoticha]